MFERLKHLLGRSKTKITDGEVRIDGKPIELTHYTANRLGELLDAANHHCTELIKVQRVLSERQKRAQRLLKDLPKNPYALTDEQRLRAIEQLQTIDRDNAVDATWRHSTFDAAAEAVAASFKLRARVLDERPYMAENLTAQRQIEAVYTQVRFRQRAVDMLEEQLSLTLHAVSEHLYAK